MTNNPFLRYVLSPLVVVILLLSVDYTSRYYDVTISMGIPVAGLFICLFWSGFRASILSAVLITGYTLYSDVYDVSRTAQVALTVWPIALGGGLLKQWLIESVKEAEREHLRAETNQAKANFVDSLNGNIELLREINQDLIRLSLAVDLLSKKDIVDKINPIQNKVANLAQRAIGWQQLAKDKKLVVGDDDPKRDE